MCSLALNSKLPPVAPSAPLRWRVRGLTFAVNTRRRTGAPWRLALGLPDPAERDAWLAEGETLLEGPTLGHNHLFFRRNAIEATIAAGRTKEARRHATALAEYVAHEPMPFTDLITRRAALLADAADGRLSAQARSELSELTRRAERTGFHRLVAPMRVALEEVTASSPP